MCTNTHTHTTGTYKTAPPASSKSGGSRRASAKKKGTDKTSVAELPLTTLHLSQLTHHCILHPSLFSYVSLSLSVCSVPLVPISSRRAPNPSSALSPTNTTTIFFDPLSLFCWRGAGGCVHMVRVHLGNAGVGIQHIRGTRYTHEELRQHARAARGQKRQGPPGAAGGAHEYHRPQGEMETRRRNGREGVC